MPKQVYSKSLGRMVWVDDNGAPLRNFNPGMGSLPGQALMREESLLSRLPDAQLAGYRGPSVVDPRPMRGARPEDPDPTPPNTYRPLAGSKQNTRGNSIILAAGPEGSTVSSSIIEASRDAGDDAEMLTFTLDVDFDGLSPGTNPSLPVELFAIIEWGIGGASFQAMIDWPRGGCFSLPASWFRIKARYVSVPAGFGAASPDAILRAAVAYGGIHHRSHVPRLTERRLDNGSSIAAGGVQNLSVPRFANAFTPIVSSVTPDLLFDMRSNFGVTDFNYGTYRYTVNTNAGIQGENIFPIPQNVNVIRMTNMLAVPYFGPIAIMWHLAL